MTLPTLLWGCRYVHSMLNPSTGLSTHLDGAIRIYDCEQILERIDAKTDISKCGKESRYVKLWRIDNDFSVAMWKELISSFYRENALIGEYFGGIDEKYEQIKKQNIEHNSVTVKPHDFEHIELTKGDGIRFFVHYTSKFELEEDSDIGIYNKEAFICQDGTRKEILDADTITLLKYLRRKGLSLRIPVTSLIDFNDMIYNFPTLCCKNEQVADVVIAAINELCQTWENNEDDRLIAFAIMVNLENEAGQVSFVGHVGDFVQLFSWIPKVSDMSFVEWIDAVYQKNNLFNRIK